MVELRLLQAAVIVAEERSVTRAADRLGLTQPALSKQLAELEARVGFVLFERSSQRFEVTEPGAAFVEHARTALTEIERAVYSGRAASHGTVTTICVVKSPNIDPYFPSMMRTIRLPLYPAFELRFSSHFSNEALRMLRAGEAGLALTCGLSDPSGFSSTNLAEEWMFVALPATDSLCVRSELGLADFSGRRLALFERQVNPAVHDKLNQVLANDGIHPLEVQRVQQAEEAAALILQCGCMSLLTKSEAWRIMDEGISIRPLNDKRLLLNTYLSARLDEDSRLIADFTRSLAKKLRPAPEQLRFATAG